MLGFAVYHLCLRLESAGQVIQVDSRLCQPAGTPIPVQTGRRLGVTLIHVETDVLSPVQVSVERRITRLAHVQATFDTLAVVFSTTNATRLARIAFGHFHDLDTLDFRLVRENLCEAVERPPVQVKIPVFTPVLRLAILVLADTFELTDIDAAHSLLDTSLDDVFGKGVEEVGSALRPLLV